MQILHIDHIHIVTFQKYYHHICFQQNSLQTGIDPIYMQLTYLPLSRVPRAVTKLNSRAFQGVIIQIQGSYNLKAFEIPYMSRPLRSHFL